MPHLGRSKELINDLLHLGFYIPGDYMTICGKGWTVKSAGEGPETPQFFQGHSSRSEAEAAEGPGVLIPLKYGQVVSQHPAKGGSVIA